MKRLIAALLALGGFLVLKPAPCLAIDVGVARVDVTPSEPIRLTGYGGRRTNNVGVEQKLWAKALALGSDSQGPALLLTLDNCGIAESTYREVIARLTKKTKLKQAGIAIACSHTHSGPCTTDWAPNIFSSDISPPQQAVIDRYTRELIDKLENIAVTALKDRRPSKLSWSQGKAEFARNRRTAGGPVDQTLPVLKISDADGKLRAIVANYACHCTTLGGEFNHVCGDWAGYAQEAIEREHPGATALITIGCGADANPSPRGGGDGGLTFSKQHGEALGAEVKRLLGLTFTPLDDKVTTRLKEIHLPFGPHFTREQWQARATNSGIVGYHARKWLGRLDRGEKTPESLYYPISTWQFGDDLALVFLPGEVVVDYALRLKREFDSQRLWVSGYANYVPCYIPSRRILAEGGYEAEDSLWYYDRPARISTNAEELIIKTVHDLLPKSFLADPKKAEFPDPKTPQQALRTFRTKAGFTVELVASEPLIESPVAIDWDAHGRLWVCEMYDYPTGLKPPPKQDRQWGEPIKEPPGGFAPGGRIKILESTKHDGRYDKATLFLDKLPFPTGVFPWRNGALICAAPDILFAEDTDGDGRADVVRTNYTGFATHNYQARVNGFRWGLDGWLHGSSGLFGGKIKSLLTGKEIDLGGRDFRIRPDTGEIEPLAGISQMGRVRDDFDNWFGNDNSTLLWHYPLPEHYMRRNPHVTYPEPRVNVAANSKFKIQNSKSPDPNVLHPVSRTLERFNHPESANRVTGACGPDIYRDNLLGAEYYGNAFICEPVANVVTRLVLEPDGVTFGGRRADGELQSEFLASTDNWFRPVQVRTGPDGALWVVDMYRFVIEHPRWIAPERLKTIDVRAGADMGRIYRVYPKGAKLKKMLNLTQRSDAKVADALNTPNGSARDLAHLELLERHTPATELERARQPASARQAPAALKRPEGRSPAARLAGLTENAPSPAARLQTLALLRDLDQLSDAHVTRALRDPAIEVRRFALSLAEGRTALLPELPGFADKPENVDSVTAFRFWLAVSGFGPDAAHILGSRYPLVGGEPRLQAAWLIAARGNPELAFQALAAPPGSAVGAAFGDTGGNPEAFAALLATIIGDNQIEALGKLLVRLVPPDTNTLNTSELWAIAHLHAEVLDHPSLLSALATHSSPKVQRSLERLRGGFVTDYPIHWLVTGQFGTLGRSAVPPVIRVLGHLAEQSATNRAQLLKSLQLNLTSLERETLRKTIGRLRRSEFARDAIATWSALTPGVRSELLSLFLARESWTEIALEAVEAGDVKASEFSLLHRQRLREHPNTEIRRRAGLVFSSATTGRGEALARFATVPSLSGAVERGGVLFDTHCAQCHAWRGHGHTVGPNLGEYAGKGVVDFVQAILDPNSAINPNFLAYNIETKDGRSLAGLVRGETASGLTLVQGGGVQETILRTDIAEIRASSLSLMPEGLEQALTPQDMADLIAWIKQAAPAPFGNASANADLAAKNRAAFLKSGASSLAKVSASAETLPYRSWLGTLPMPYCRQSAGANRLAWESAAGNPLTPALSHSEGEREKGGAAGRRTIDFRFPAAMGFLSQPSGKFTLKLNGAALLDFNVSLADETWQSADGRARMSYAVTETSTEDSCGVLRIELAADLVKTGEPALFEVIGSDSGSQRWFGIYDLNAKR